MVLFYVLGFVVLVALGVVGFLFYLLNKESAKENEVKVVPISSFQDTMRSEAPSIIEVEYQKRASELEEELKIISERSIAQGKEALVMIDQLTKENEELKRGKDKVQSQAEQLLAAEKQADLMRQDNYLVQTQLDSAYVKVEELQQEIIVVRQRMEDDLAKANQSIEQIKSEREAILSNRESSTQASQGLARERDELKIQNDYWDKFAHIFASSCNR